MIERVPGILSEKELADVEKRFGVGEAQVRRDHVISHVLAAIAEVGPDDILFFGGTALSRTHLSGLRLSEDVDLIALGNRSEIADRVERAIIRGVGRSLGSPSFVPHLREVRHSNP